jgi:uncharacterized protein (TIGR02118 family)
MARMVVIYRTPKNVESFDRHYFEIHVPLAKKIPGLRKYEVSDGPIATPVGTSNVHRIGTLHFDDLAAIEKAFASAEGQAAGASPRRPLEPPRLPAFGSRFGSRKGYHTISVRVLDAVYLSRYSVPQEVRH